MKLMICFGIGDMMVWVLYRNNVSLDNMKLMVCFVIVCYDGMGMILGWYDGAGMRMVLGWYEGRLWNCMCYHGIICMA